MPYVNRTRLLGDGNLRALRSHVCSCACLDRGVHVLPSTEECFSILFSTLIDHREGEIGWKKFPLVYCIVSARELSKNHPASNSATTTTSILLHVLLQAWPTKSILPNSTAVLLTTLQIGSTKLHIS